MRRRGRRWPTISTRLCSSAWSPAGSLVRGLDSGEEFGEGNREWPRDARRRPHELARGDMILGIRADDTHAALACVDDPVLRYPDVFVIPALFDVIPLARRGRHDLDDENRNGR